MSHIVSLRSASLRALRSSSTVVATSKCPTYPNRSCQHQQQYSYSTLPPSSNRNLITKKVRMYLISLLTSNIKTQYFTSHIRLSIRE
jgi:hypothetical protein